MLPKEKFKKYMNYIVEKEKIDCEINDLITNHPKVFTDGIFPVDNITGMMVQLMEEIMCLPIDDDYGSFISRWLWTYNYGEDFEVGNMKFDNLDEEHRTPDISTIDKLYDFCVWYTENVEKETPDEFTFYDFERYIEYLKEKDEINTELYNIFNDFSRIYQDGRVPIDIGNDFLLELIETRMNVQTETLVYWIYEMDFGRKFEIGDIVDESFPEGNKNREPDISTLKKLYDYLMFEKTKK